MTHSIEPVNNLLQRREKRPAILIIVKDGFAPVTTRGDMVKRIGKLYADGAGHGKNNSSAGAAYLDLAPIL